MQMQACSLRSSGDNKRCGPAAAQSPGPESHSNVARWLRMPGGYSSRILWPSPMNIQLQHYGKLENQLVPILVKLWFTALVNSMLVHKKRHINTYQKPITKTCFFKLSISHIRPQKHNPNQLKGKISEYWSMVPHRWALKVPPARYAKWKKWNPIQSGKRPETEVNSYPSGMTMCEIFSKLQPVL